MTYSFTSLHSVASDADIFDFCFEMKMMLEFWRRELYLSLAFSLERDPCTLFLVSKELLCDKNHEQFQLSDKSSKMDLFQNIYRSKFNKGVRRFATS